jgi:DNA-binding GntR family transcriptional regulator
MSASIKPAAVSKTDKKRIDAPPPASSTSSGSSTAHEVASAGARERRDGPPRASSAPSGGSAAHAVASVGAKERRDGPPRASSAPPGGSAAHAVASVGATYSDKEIYEQVVSAILDHRLPPGTKLVEDKLATAFGVSRTRIRPVLVRLANEQVVTLTPNRGASVTQLTVEEAREVFEVRRLIEPPLAVRFIGIATDADMQDLSRCIDEEEAARESGDARRAIRLSGDFHLCIAERAGHQTLGRILRELVSRTSLILMAYSAPNAHLRARASACGCLEHRALLDAIRLRDPVETTRLMQEHLSRIEAELEFNPRADPTDLTHVFGQAA